MVRSEARDVALDELSEGVDALVDDVDGAAVDLRLQMREQRVDLADEIDVLQARLLDQEVLQHLVVQGGRLMCKGGVWSAYLGEI